MALFRKFRERILHTKPDGLVEIFERVYVFDSCLSKDAVKRSEFKEYLHGIVPQLHDFFPDASFRVVNFRGVEKRSLFSEILTTYEISLVDYPQEFGGCPLLPLEMIDHFLRSSESWLSIGRRQNVLLMHCERGAWPVLAFMLAALWVSIKHDSASLEILEMVYQKAPFALLQFWCPLNPKPSQVRYLQCIWSRHFLSDWPPPDIHLYMDCLILRDIPLFEGRQEFKPVIRIYGQNLLTPGDRSSKLLFSTSKFEKHFRHYLMEECCMLVKIHIHFPVQGDVFLECAHLDGDLQQELMLFRVMFHTGFLQHSRALTFHKDEVDMSWEAMDLFPEDFRGKVLFEDVDAVTSSLISYEEESALFWELFEVEETLNRLLLDGKIVFEEGYQNDIDKHKEEDIIGGVCSSRIQMEHSKNDANDDGCREGNATNLNDQSTSTTSQNSTATYGIGSSTTHMEHSKNDANDEGCGEGNATNLNDQSTSTTGQNSTATYGIGGVGLCRIQIEHSQNNANDEGCREGNSTNHNDQSTSTTSLNSTAIYGIGGVGSNQIQLENSKNKFNYGTMSKTIHNTNHYPTATAIVSGKSSVVSTIDAVGLSTILRDHIELNYRRIGDEVTQMTNKSTEKPEKADEISGQSKNPSITTTSNPVTLVISRRKLLSSKTASMDPVSCATYRMDQTLAICLYLTRKMISTQLWFRGCGIDLAKRLGRGVKSGRVLGACKYIRGEVLSWVSIQSCLKFGFPLLLFFVWRRL